MRYAMLAVMVAMVWGCAVCPAVEPATRAAARAERPMLSVAILDFQADTPGNVELGKQIGETLTATLSAENGFTLVDRASMSKTLSEHELNLTGLVSPDQATRIGKLVGAKILVTGKAFALDKQMFVTAKIIGTETSLVEGVLVKGRRDGDVADLVMQLSEKIAVRLREVGPTLVAAADDAKDPLPALRQRLAGKKLPVLALVINEEHVSQHPRVIDPPVDTELRMMLVNCGFTVIDMAEITKGKGNVEVTIKGEAISEFAARIGNLVSCSSRVEVRLVNTDGKTLLADRVTGRAADLSEQIAAKTALQNAAHQMGLKILEYFANSLPEAKAN